MTLRDKCGASSHLIARQPFGGQVLALLVIKQPLQTGLFIRSGGNIQRAVGAVADVNASRFLKAAAKAGQ